MTDLCEAAKRGAEFLDEKEPGWARRVSPFTLSIRSAQYCVLGQLDGLGNFDLSLGKRKLSIQDGSHLGFALSNDLVLDPDAWDEITACWKDEIRARRGKE